MIIDQGWKEYSGSAYRCPVYLSHKADGGYSAVAANLPGVACEGGTEREALDGIKESLAAAISVYKEGGAAIPWLHTPREPMPGAKTLSIIVHL